MSRTPKPKAKARVLVLNGPNLNLLGKREPEIYGSETLGDIEKAAKAHGRGLGLTVEFRQSNAEGELVSWLHEAREKADGVILNGGAYTHTSIALRDAALALETPLVEVHLSNLFKRETFRHHSYISDVAEGLICGFGAQGYLLALDAMARLIRARQGKEQTS
jgi:3-dehydroquinate dehydratase-2